MRRGAVEQDGVTCAEVIAAVGVRVFDLAGQHEDELDAFVLESRISDSIVGQRNEIRFDNDVTVEGALVQAVNEAAGTTEG